MSKEGLSLYGNGEKCFAVSLSFVARYLSEAGCFAEGGSGAIEVP